MINLCKILNKVSIGLTILIIPAIANANTLSLEERCTQPKATDPIIYRTDFDFNTPLDKMKLRFQEMYHDKKRLRSHAWYDSQSKTFKINTDGVGGDNRTITLSKYFIDSVTKHIETALRLKYANFIFFPDMGHAHILIPQAHWDKNYAGKSTIEYEKLLADHEVKFLYHTAEMLNMSKRQDSPPGSKGFELTDDKFLLWRYFTRNIIADNNAQGFLEVHVVDDPQKQLNTVAYLKDYYGYISGFNISAHEQGCFTYTYEGQNYNYDLSLQDLECEPSRCGDDDSS